MMGTTLIYRKLYVLLAVAWLLAVQFQYNSVSANTDCPTFPYTVPAGDVTALKHAITCANATLDDDVINLTNSTYTLTEVDNTRFIQTSDVGDNGLPVIEDIGTAGTLTITGNGAIIERSSAENTPEFRIFLVNSGGSLLLNSTTVRNGSIGFEDDGATTGTPDVLGGAILNLGAITVDSSTLTGNRAEVGGGMFSQGNAYVVDTIFTGNEAEDQAGGIYSVQNAITIERTTFQNNSAGFGGGFSNAGGSIAEVIDSTFTGNTATDQGGAIRNFDAILTVTGTSVSGNSGPRGGGFANHNGSATITGSTFDSNSALVDGGGIYSDNDEDAQYDLLEITDTTLSSNTAESGNGGGLRTYNGASIMG
ncbi:MAG: hypothetical protein AAF653_14145, partial [Chloroflexota bacterium]